jgi:hypothetical protein
MVAPTATTAQQPSGVSSTVTSRSFTPNSPGTSRTEAGFTGQSLPGR